MADVPHYCSACGEIHGGSSRESEEVKIAKINADRDIEVARLANSAMRTEAATAEAVAETVAEAEMEIATTEAAAQVDEATVTAEVLDEIVNPEPEPGVVVVPPPAEPDGDGVAAPPETAHHETANKGGSGWWDEYS